MSDAFLSLKNLRIAYGDSVAVSNLSIDIRKGELLALLGPSGCGKTTTMRAIAGLLNPVSGQIMLDGKTITSTPANRRDIGLVFQAYALFPHLSAFENVAFGLRMQKLPAAEIKERTMAGLELVSMASFATRKPAELSGGQQQRLALARSLVVNPKLLLLDEPLSNLDAKLRLEMRAELQRVQKETGVTMIFVTHDQAEALGLADRVVLMREGEIEQIGSPPEIYNQPGSLFAADFMGFENIFKIADNKIQGPAGMLPFAFDGAASHLAWRPNEIVLGARKSTKTPFPATVEAVSFAGGHREYILSSQIGKISLHQSVEGPAFTPEMDVFFGLPKERAVAFDR
jgi:putative spermidine/putrescine transport system ATP-binding protein